jgi:V8-like Glu-specific endopeptidase
MLLIVTSTVFGQNNDLFKKAPIPDQIPSDKSYQKIFEAKKTWQPIPVPVFRKSGTPDVSETALSVLVYDLATKAVTRSVPSRLNEKGIAPEPAEKVFDSDPGSQQVETIFPPDDRIKISPTNEYPWRTICKLYITFPDGNNFVASGVIVGRSDGIGFHCLTAGHCVYRKEYGGWADKIEVIPALDNDYTPFYSARATLIKANDGWINNSMPEYDWACITLDRQVGNFTGWMGRYTTDDLDWYKGTFHCAGYPIDRDFGLCLYYDSDSGRDADQFFHWYYMDTFSGQSGMPIWTKDGNTRKIVALHIADADSTGSNVGIRLNREKLAQLDQWLMEDPPPPNFPDLVDDGPKWSSFNPDTVVRGFSPLKIKHIIRNIGTARSAPVTVAYYASSDEKIESGNDILLGTFQLSTLSPFYATDVEWSGVFPKNTISGDYYIGWLIDPNNNLLEFTEDNNNGFIPSKQLHVIDPYITVQCPNGGEPFAIGEENLVQWFTAGGSGLITIDVSYDNGGSWQNLVTNFSDSGKYLWNIPRSQTSVFTCLIRITDTFENLMDESNAAFILETRPTIPGIPQDEGIYTSKTATLFSWTTAHDPETGISGYQIQVGTSPDGNDLADTLIDNQLEFAAATQHNKTIFARLRAINGVGLEGPWSSSSDGIFADLTPPILQGGPYDEGEFCGTESVVFRWNAAIEEETGFIMNYKLQVGTAIGLNDVFDKWINRRLEYTVVGKHGQTLYARIRAHNAAIGVSDWSDWSDGITIDLTPPSAPGIPTSEDLALNFFDVPFFWNEATEDISEVTDYHLKVIDVNADSQVVFDEWIGNVLDFLVPAKDGQALLAFVQAKNNAGLIGPWADATGPVSIQLTPALLTFIKGSRAFEGEGWDNAIDNDIVDWDGTVTAFTSEQPYAIFGFLGGGEGRVQKVKLLTDTKVAFRNRWVTKFSVLYSTTGIEDNDFMPLLEGTKNIGDWEEYCFPEQSMKFIKLIVDQPNSATIAYCQVGEFQVFGQAMRVETEKAELQVTRGTGTEPEENWANAIDGDIEGWDGTVTAISDEPPAYVIFNFADLSIKNVTKIRILSDTGVRFAFRWLKRFHLEVSTTGIQRADFSTIFSADKNNGGWESFYFDPVPAKYIKLVLDNPDPTESDYCQIGEVEIFTQAAAAPMVAHFSGQMNIQSEQTAIVTLPESFSIEQNYPNPFNPETTIRYQLPIDSRVSLTIHNLMGQKIVSLVAGNRAAGFHAVTWNGRDAQGSKVPSGVYLYNFSAGDFRVTKKMILIE